MSNQCGFVEAWIGSCKNPNPCEKHSSLKCYSCGDPATKNCGETGQFVCGAPLCDNCEHTIADDGCNGLGFGGGKYPEGMTSHCRKSDQQHKPWYAQKAAGEEK